MFAERQQRENDACAASWRGRACARRRSEGMRWFMYRRPLAGVFEFGLCGKRRRREAKSKAPAGGQRYERHERKNDVALRAKHRNHVVLLLGTGVVFTSRLPAGAHATERRLQRRRQDAGGTNCANQTARRCRSLRRRGWLGRLWKSRRMRAGARRAIVLGRPWRGRGD